MRRDRAGRYRVRIAAPIPDLVALLEDRDRGVRLAVLRSFSRLGHPRLGDIPAEARKTVLDLSRDPDREIRRAAARLVGGDAVSKEPVVAGPVAAPKDPNAEVRAAAANHHAPANPGRGVILDRKTDRLFALLGDANDRVRAAAGAELENLGPEIAPRLFRVLADPKTSRTARGEVLLLLAGRYGSDSFPDEDDPVLRGPEVRAAIPALRVLALDIDPTIALDAVHLLMMLEPRQDEIARLFLQGLRVEGSREINTMLFHGRLEPTMIPAFLGALRDPDPDFRADVIRVIAEVGGGLDSVMEEIEAAGEKPTPEEREEWAQNHRLIVRAVNALIPLLKDTDPAVRWNAAMTLGRLGSEPGRAVPALIEMAKTESGHVPISEHLMKPPDLTSEYYAGGSYLLGWDERDGEPMRIAAMQGLGLFGPRAAAAVPELARILRDENDPRLLWYTAAAVAEIGPEAKAAVPPLIAALRSKRTATGRTVTYIGYGVSFGWSKEEGPVRLAAAVAFGKIGADAREAVPELTRSLADADPRVRGEAAAALGAIGPESASAVPELARLAVEEREELLADLVTKSLGAIGPPAVPALISLVRTGRPEVRLRAMKALGEVGAKADAALPELILAMDDRDEEIRTAAAEALGAVGSGPRERAAILPLLEALKDDDRVVREQAAKALSQIGARTEEAVPGLIDAMKTTAIPPLIAAIEDEDPVVRQHAARALGRIGARTDRVVPALVRALKDPDGPVRLRAVEALGAIGPGRAAAIDDLRRLGDDPELPIRQAAAATIQAIRSGAP